MEIDKKEIEFDIECENCGENWQENLLDVIDLCTPEELLYLQEVIKKKKSKN